MIDTVLFIYSDQPIIDRGWDPHYVKIELSRLGFHIQDLYVKKQAEIFDFFTNNSKNLLVWPVCYTIGHDVDGCLLTDVLFQLKIPFIGSSANVLELNSKIKLKERLKGSKFHTPDYKIIDSESVDSIDLPIPYLMKTEYTCNSEGVSVVSGILESHKIYDLLIGYGQRILAEKWERKSEYTVAYIHNKNKPIVAPIGMEIVSGDLYINSDVKLHNNHLQFKLPSEDIRDILINHVSNFADYFSIDGYFRIDILINDRNKLCIIDVNFLPTMNSLPDSFSYFPICFRINYGFSFQQVICAMLKSAQEMRGIVFAQNIQKEMQSIKFPKGGKYDSK